MKKKITAVIGLVILASVLVSGCGKKDGGEDANTQKQTEDAAGRDAAEEPGVSAEADLEDGIYCADFNTDSGMFHINEACGGKGTLTVKDGKMTIHISLVSKNIEKLYPGLAEDAVKEGAELLEPTIDTVAYSDGMSEEVFGFDVPVPVLEEEFDLALVGTKGKWYDHRVSVSNPEPIESE